MSTARRTPVADTGASPHARLAPVGVSAVRVTDEFWAPRLERNRTTTVPHQHQLCESTGALDNFRRAAGRLDAPFQGMYYSDSDVYKWLEAACWALAADESDEDLRGRIDDTIELFAAAQDESGYLNTYFSVDRVEERWSDLVVRHEMYCLGHLIQAAVTHHRVTGSMRLLEVATRACAHVEDRFPPGEIPGTCGHPGMEMALVELYRTTSDERWLRLALWQLDSRGRGILLGREYLLDHAPILEQDSVTGHAVRALYLYSALADVVLETGDPQLRATLDRLWNDLAQHKTSVTGGVGARWDGESFGDAYELPERAYNETCAAIAHIFLAWRLLLLTGDGVYRDVIETALYNGVLPGLSLSGTEFFYQNPLADAGRHRREPWFECACCPPNIARLLAALPGYALSTSERERAIWLHLLIGLSAEVEPVPGLPVRLEVRSALPAAGSVQVRVDPARPARFTVQVPVPSWAESVRVRIGSEQIEVAAERGYLPIERDWQPGTVIDLELPLTVRSMQSHPRVAATHHQIAVTRGPLVFCIEQADHADPVPDLRLRPDQDWQVGADPNLGDAVTLTTTGVAGPADDGPLHRTAGGEAPELRPAPVRAVPYYAWGNREPGPMRVFVPLA